MFRRAKFEKLLEPLQIKQVRLRNRMVKPGQILNLAGEGNYAGDRVKAFYEELAKGGVGLIIVESTCVDFPLGISASTMPRLVIADDKFIPSLRELAEVIHKHGCPTFLQIAHAGPAHPGTLFGDQPVAASSLSNGEKPTPYFETARELTIPEIENIEDKFAEAALRAKKAGFDGVELHAGHRYLMNSFLSCAWNKRQDAYGCQDLGSRTRFLVETIRKIKGLIGEFVVGVRYNGGEWGLEKGITAEEAVGIGKMLEQAGADFLHLTGYGYGSYALVQYPEHIMYPEVRETVKPLAKKIKKPGVLVTRAEAVKKVVSIPVIGVGRLDPKLGNWLLREGKVDLIALGRRLMADPELPNKVASGRLDDIRPCTACLHCISGFYSGEVVRCEVNARMGKELEYQLRPAEKKKRILVVGGGPGGMEAARVAALRGHKVFLYEKERKLGGLMPLTILIKGAQVEDTAGFLRYLRNQIKKLGVEVKVGKQVTPKVVSEIKPDVIILATGGMSAVPEIPGISSRNVVTGERLSRIAKTPLMFLGPRLLGWLTRFWLPVGKRVVIIGGQIHGCELAEFLVKRGREITIVETSDQIGAGVPELKRPRLLAWLAERGAAMLAGVKYEKITDQGLTLITKEGARKTIEADTIVVATPPVPDTELFKTLKGNVAEAYMVGDCKKAGLMLDAVTDAVGIADAI